MMPACRPALALVHRWVGLVMAGFLLLAGLTGALLAWNEELDAWASPRLLRAAPPAPGAPMLDPLALRQRVQALHPEAYAAMAYLQQEPGRAAVVRLFGLPNPATGQPVEPPNDQVFVNPYTGEVLGERKWGDISQGLKNLMPFVYTSKTCCPSTTSAMAATAASATTMSPTSSSHCSVTSFLVAPMRASTSWMG